MRRVKRWLPLVGSLALLLGLGAFGLALVRDSREAAELAHRQTTVQKQATVASLADQYLQLAAKEAFEFGATHDLALTPDAPGDRAMLEELLAKQGGFFNYGAVLAGLDGTVLTVVAPAPGLPDSTDPGYAPLRASLLARAPGISSVMHTEDGDVPLVAVGVPILEGERPRAFLIAYFRVDTSHLQRYSAQLGRGSEAIGMIVDGDGTVVAARDASLLGGPAPDSPALDPDASGTSGTADFERDGTDMVAAWAPIPTGGWSLVEEQPAGAFYAAVRQQSQTAQVALLGLLVAGALAVTILNHRTDLARRRAERRGQALVKDASDVITVVDADGAITYASPAMERVLGYDPDDRLGTAAVDLVHPDDVTLLRAAVTAVRATPDGRQRLQARALRRDGIVCHCEMVISNLEHVRGVEGVVVSLRDITELVTLHDELAHRATHDPLTALPNRAKLQETVRHALASAETHGEVATLFLDLDGFKAVNDELGHEAGDDLLVQVADRLRVCVRDGDTVGRIGGDEFVVVVHGRDALATAQHVAKRSLDLLHQPFEVGGREVTVGVSIGIALGGPERAPDEVLRLADAAMYRAKEDGRGRVVVHEVEPPATPAPA